MLLDMGERLVAGGALTGGNYPAAIYYSMFMGDFRALAKGFLGWVSIAAKIFESGE